MPVFVWSGYPPSLWINEQELCLVRMPLTFMELDVGFTN
jgi:hypothetical protein